jgi:uncharacterized protein YgiM (DUF1202 family)/lysophospholipase L1-like esterase
MSHRYEKVVIYTASVVLLLSCSKSDQNRRKEQSRRSSATLMLVGEESGAKAKLVRDEPVMAGPMGEYKQVGAVFAGEEITVLAVEDGHFYIAYDADGKGRRRGFVPIASVDNVTEITPSPSEVIKTGYASYVTEDVRVYDGPAEEYYADGALSKDEGVTVFTSADSEMNGFTEVEYGTAKGTRRGFVPSSVLADERSGVLYKVKGSAPVYAGPDATYFKAGAVSEGELVVVLEREEFPAGHQKWLYVEYNKSDIKGRKRGYIQKEFIAGVFDSLPGDEIGMARYDEASRRQGIAKVSASVYTGPGPQYANPGSVNAGERVTVFSRDERGYIFIEYNTRNSSLSKRGFIHADLLEVVAAPVALPEPAYLGSDVTRVKYGSSGRNRDLYYYKIGRRSTAINDKKRIAIVIAGLHGFEDQWNRDGEILVRVANRTIEKAAAHAREHSSSLNGWELYVIPAANPDGLLEGWTNDGPGRCTYGGYDINRSFPFSPNPGDFAAIATKRNYTGTRALLAPEAKALYDLIKELKDSVTDNDEVILYDLQGWLDSILVNSPRKDITAGFKKRFPSLSSGRLGKGQVAYWAQAYGIDAATIEFPIPKSFENAEAQGFYEKGADSILEYITGSLPAEPVRKSLKIVQLGDSYSAGPGGSGEVTQEAYTKEQARGCYRSVEDLGARPVKYGNWAYQYVRHLLDEKKYNVSFKSWACSGAQTPEIADGIPFLGKYSDSEGGEAEKSRRVKDGYAPDGSKYVARTLWFNEFSIARELLDRKNSLTQRAIDAEKAVCERKYGGFPEVVSCECKHETAKLEAAVAASYKVSFGLGFTPTIRRDISCIQRLDKQVNRLEGDEDLILLTLGGNDVGFAEIVKVCYVGRKLFDMGWKLHPMSLILGSCADVIDDKEHILKTTFKNNLKKALQNISQRAPHATIVLLQYPRLDRQRSWGAWDDGIPARLYALADTMDDIQSTAVSEFNSTAGNRVIFLDKVKERFVNHEPCPNLPAGQCPDPWLKDVPHIEAARVAMLGDGLFKADMPLQFTLYHPNASGHYAIGSVLKENEAAWIK